MARSDAKLKNLPRETLDELWELKYPSDPAQKALGLVEIAALLPDQYGITIGKSALAEFYVWLEVQRRMWAREQLIDQVKEIIARDASLSAEQVRKAGQRLFMADGILERDVAKFATAASLEGEDYRAAQKDREIELRKEANAIARERLNAATRSKIDAGLDALYDEIKGNPKAVELFQQIKEIVRKA
jgi:hypothetical protein